MWEGAACGRWSSWKDLGWVEDLIRVVLILTPGQLELLTKSARPWKELPFVGHLSMPLCLTELPCTVAIYIYCIVSQLPCCTWVVPKSKLNDGWPVLGRSSIVHSNHLHKVGLDHSLKYHSALLFSFFFAWRACQWSCPRGVPRKLEWCWEALVPGERRALGCPPEPITAWQFRCSEMGRPTSRWAECQPGRWAGVWAASRAHTCV